MGNGFLHSSACSCHQLNAECNRLTRPIGPTSAWLLVMEFFGWRGFRNRREVAALAGLVRTPYNSGDSERDQGI